MTDDNRPSEDIPERGARCRNCGHYETDHVRAVATYAHCPSCNLGPHWQRVADEDKRPNKAPLQLSAGTVSALLGEEDDDCPNEAKTARRLTHPKQVFFAADDIREVIENKCGVMLDDSQKTYIENAIQSAITEALNRPDNAIAGCDPRSTCSSCYAAGHGNGLTHALTAVSSLGPLATMKAAIDAIQYLQGSTFAIPRSVPHRQGSNHLDYAIPKPDPTEVIEAVRELRKHGPTPRELYRLEHAMNRYEHVRKDTTNG